MPNWCMNDVTMRHSDPVVIEQAVKAYQQGQLLNEFVPMPQDVAGTDAWYQWCVNNWGTKWDVGGDGEFIEQPDANTINLKFDSAWAPPTEAYQVMCGMGFEIQAFYYEPGMGFVGEFTGDSQGGNDNYYEFGDWSAEQVRTDIPELDERFGISQWIEDSAKTARGQCEESLEDGDTTPLGEPAQ